MYTAPISAAHTLRLLALAGLTAYSWGLVDKPCMMYAER